MTPDEVAAHFTRTDGSYVFARWGRPIVPVVFGLADETLPVVKGALEAVATLAGLQIADADVELGANLMFFFLRDWQELLHVPGLEKMVPELATLCPRLQAKDANQYRLFRFDAQGCIRAAFVFLRMDAALEAVPAADIALSQVVQVFLLWSDRAFAARQPLARLGDSAVLRPEIAALIRAGYDPVLPDQSRDPAHALRLFARANALHA